MQGSAKSYLFIAFLGFCWMALVSPPSLWGLVQILRSIETVLPAFSAALPAYVNIVHLPENPPRVRKTLLESLVPPPMQEWETMAFAQWERNEWEQRMEMEEELGALPVMTVPTLDATEL